MDISDSLGLHTGMYAPLGYPTFIRYLTHARNCILPRVSHVVLIVVDPNMVTGFINSERLANTTSLTRLNYSSLHDRISLNSVRLVSAPHIKDPFNPNDKYGYMALASIRYLIYIKRTPRGVPEESRRKAQRTRRSIKLKALSR